MRISDWSSDVCSSDLSARLGIFGKSILKGERLQAGTPRPAPAIDDDAAPAIVTADSHDPRYAQPYVDINELRSEPVPHRYVHGGFHGSDARFRSEEHTSELQSLMRISYAVFCLKKKKKQHNI